MQSAMSPASCRYSSDKGRHVSRLSQDSTKEDSMEETPYDVIVVGAGNAALCAATTASEGGAKVLVLERAPQESRGGNSIYAGGGFRMVHNGLETIKKV